MSVGENKPASVVDKSGINNNQQSKHPLYHEYYQYPYGPYRPPYSFTRQGVNFMFFALIVTLFRNTFSTIILPIQRMVLIDGTITQFMTIIILSSIVSSFLLLINLILMGLSLHSFYKGRFEFNEKHPKNVIWSIWFLVSYFVILFFYIFLISPLIFVFVGMGGSVYFVVFSSFMDLFSAFVIGFALLQLVRNFAGKLEKDLLYIYASSLILLSIFWTVMEVIFIQFRFNFDVYGSIYYYSFINVISILITCIALIAYYRLGKGFDQYGRYIPQESKIKIPQPKPYSDYVFRFYLKPIRALIIIIIIGCLVSGIYGSSYLSLISSARSGPSHEDSEPMIYTYSESDIGIINEGQESVYETQVDGYLIHYTVKITWTDEPDEPLRTNEPDQFTIFISFNNSTNTDSAANQRGDEGILIVSDHFEIGTLWVSFIQVIITLDYAGDQVGPIGIAGSPLTIVDNSNEFNYEINFEYTE